MYAISIEILATLWWKNRWVFSNRADHLRMTELSRKLERGDRIWAWSGFWRLNDPKLPIFGKSGQDCSTAGEINKLGNLLCHSTAAQIGDLKDSMDRQPFVDALPKTSPTPWQTLRLHKKAYLHFMDCLFCLFSSKFCNIYFASYCRNIHN